MHGTRVCTNPARAFQLGQTVASGCYNRLPGEFNGPGESFCIMHEAHRRTTSRTGTGSRISDARLAVSLYRSIQLCRADAGDPCLIAFKRLEKSALARLLPKQWVDVRWARTHKKKRKNKRRTMAQLERKKERIIPPGCAASRRRISICRGAPYLYIFSC